MYKLYTLAVLIAAHIYVVSCATRLEWDPTINFFLRMNENVPKDTYVFTVRVLEAERYGVVYKILEGSDVFRFRDEKIESELGEVYVHLPPDYESVKTVNLEFQATARDGSFIRREGQMIIDNVNDLSPEFSQARYSINIPEDTPVGTTLFDFWVKDFDDTANVYLRVTCDRSQPTGSYCDFFELRFTGGSNQQWNGMVILAKPVDYENQTLYQLPIVADDGLNPLNRSMKIQIVNIQDTPPRFHRIEKSEIPEERQAGFIIQTVEAYDGDYPRGDPKANRIQYEFEPGPGDVYQQLFEIGSTDGVIRTKKVLDVEGDRMVYPDGIFNVKVVAREIDGVTGAVGNSAIDSISRTITITVSDINDNRPIFDRTNFNVTIPENSPKDSTLSNVNIYVSDRDVTEKNANFTLTLVPDTRIFGISTTQVLRETTASIIIRNATALDYESPLKTYILRVIATEFGYPPTTATVTVNLEDVNDNVPVFAGPFPYNISVIETEQPGLRTLLTVTATDIDSGFFGSSGIVYTLTGAGSNLFRISPGNGEIRVNACNSPGKDPCIDYETRRRYDLGITAVDSSGLDGANSAYADLVIHILDDNDNAPTFPIGLNLTSYIYERQTVPQPPVVVEAVDRDQVGGPPSYSLISGGDYWQINSVTGAVTSRNPVVYSDTPGNRGFFRLTAMATDGKFNVTTEITIFVIEVNDNIPQFQQPIYRDSIREGQRGDALEFILTVSATDADSSTSSAGEITYDIDVGGQGKFAMDHVTGNLTTAKQAFFDYDIQREFNLTIIARDNGIPQQTGTAYVIITVLDQNNKNPYIRPQTRRADVYENVVIGTSVYRIDGIDPDAGAVLNYRFVEPKSAITPQGEPIDRAKYDYSNLFRMNDTTGIIYTASPLDRDKASVVTYTMEVLDITANPRQTGTGTLIITILEYNDQSPAFLPYPNITIPEDQPSGTFVLALKAVDEDDPIDEYRMFESPQNFFSIGTLTGVVVTTDRIIDFEEIEETYFIVQVFDGGFPRLSATASVHVTIINVNDNSPIFDQPSYRLSVNENSPGDTSLLRVRATDKDKGHFGQVKYFLTDRFNRFYMNNDTGEIFVAPGAVLDRETTPTIDILVTAYDSQLDPSVRRFTEVSIYIFLNDVNDNPPVFKQDEYIVRIPETIPINTEIIQVAATDRDVGRNADVTFAKVIDSGDPDGYFALNSLSGRIRVSNSLLRKTGTYKFQVLASDTVFTTYANVTVIVFEAANSQPIWVIPPRTNMTIEVLESQYEGMLVYQVSAKDEDSGTNGVVDYAFSVGNNPFISVSPEFHINSITGVIRAQRVFDREERDRYVLILVARDRGNPYLETQRSLTVVIIDVNDNVPVFPQSGIKKINNIGIGDSTVDVTGTTVCQVTLVGKKNQFLLCISMGATQDGQTIPYRFQVSENAPKGHSINRVLATDADLNPEIFYYIIGGNEDDTFFLNKTTGELFLKSTLDRESKDIYRLYIQATNNVSDYSVITNRKKRELDPSIAEVIITIGNTNDMPPVFTQERYHGCISEEAPVQQSIVQVQAIDKDAYGNIRYRITSGNPGGALSIDPINGVIYNNILMKNQQNFVLGVQADDTAGGVTLTAETAANVLIFVTQKNKEVKLVITQPASEVRTFISNYQTMLQKFTQDSGQRYFDYICFSDIRDHVLDDGKSTTLWSDVYLSAICANCFGRNYYIYSESELLQELSKLQKDNKDTFDLLYVKDMEPATTEETYIDYMPTLVVMIIIIVLFLLIIVAIIIACCWISRSNEKKRGLIARHQVEEPVVFDSMPPEKNVNPVYDNRGYEHEEPIAQYAQVLKRRELEPDRPPQPEPEPSPRDSDYPEAIETMDVIIRDDDDDDDVSPSPEHSPQESPRVDAADEEFIIETQVL